MKGYVYVVRSWPFLSSFYYLFISVLIYTEVELLDFCIFNEYLNIKQSPPELINTAQKPTGTALYVKIFLVDKKKKKKKPLGIRIF